MTEVPVRLLPFEFQCEQPFRLNLHVLDGELRFGQNAAGEFPSLTAVFRFADERADWRMMADLLADVAIRKIIATYTKRVHVRSFREPTGRKHVPIEFVGFTEQRIERLGQAIDVTRNRRHGKGGHVLLTNDTFVFVEETSR